MKKKILNTLKFIIFIGIGVFLFWKVYKDQPIEDLVVSAKNTNYWWITLSIVVGIFSHIIRALRWDIALKSNKITARRDNLFYSVMIGYFANLAVPRMGEVTRAAVLKKYNNVPFSIGFGTIVTERLVDMLVLLCMTVLVILLQNNVLAEFIINNPSVSENLQNIFSVRNIIISGCTLIAAVLLYLAITSRDKKSNSLFGKIFGKLDSFKTALLSVFKLEKPALYIFYSILIWVLYFLGLYTACPAFDFFEVSSIGIMEALTVFVLASYGMVVPVQGGLGAYHFMVISTLIIYGVSDTDSRLFALIVHATQTLLSIVAGALSLVAIITVNKKRKKSNG